MAPVIAGSEAVRSAAKKGGTTARRPFMDGGPFFVLLAADGVCEIHSFLKI